MTTQKKDQTKEIVQNQYRIRGFRPKDWVLSFLFIIAAISAVTLLFFFVRTAFAASIALSLAAVNRGRENSENSLTTLNDRQLIFKNSTLHPFSGDFKKAREYLNKHREFKKTSTSLSDEKKEEQLKLINDTKKISVQADRSLKAFHDSLITGNPIQLKSKVHMYIFHLLETVEAPCPFLFIDLLINTAAFINTSPPKNINHKDTSDFSKIRDVFTICMAREPMKFTYNELLAHAFIESPSDGQEVSINFRHNDVIIEPDILLHRFTFSRLLFSYEILKELEKNSYGENGYFNIFLSRSEIQKNQYIREFKFFLKKNTQLKNESKLAVQKYLSDNKPFSWSDFILPPLFYLPPLISLVIASAIIYFQKRTHDKFQKKSSSIASTILLDEFNEKNIFINDEAIALILEKCHSLALQNAIKFDEYFFINRPISERAAFLEKETNESFEHYKKSKFNPVNSSTLKLLGKFAKLELIDTAIKIHIKGSDVYTKINSNVFHRDSLFNMILAFFSTAIASFDKDKLSITLHEHTFIQKDKIKILTKNLESLKFDSDLFKKEPAIKSKHELTRTNINHLHRNFESIKTRRHQTKEKIDLKLKNLETYKNSIYLQGSVFLVTEKDELKKQYIEKINSTKKLAETIENKNDELLRKLNFNKNINELDVEIESTEKKLVPLYEDVLDARINILLNAQEHLDQLEIIDRKIRELNKIIETYQIVSTNIDEQVKQLNLEIHSISNNLEIAEAIIRVDQPEEDDDLGPNNEQVKVEDKKSFNLALPQEEKHEIISNPKKPDGIKLEEEKKEPKQIINDDEFENPEHWRALAPKDERLLEDFNSNFFKKEKTQKKKTDTINVKQKSNDEILQEQRALASQYLERLNAFLNAQSNNISTPAGCLPAAILYQTFKFFHAFDKLIKQYENNKCSTDDLNIFNNDPYLRHAYKIRNILRHPAGHGFSANFFKNPEKIKALIGSLQELIILENHFNPSKKSKNVLSNNSEKITFNFEELLNCNQLGLQFVNIISPDIKNLAKDNVDYALKMLVSIHTYIYKNPQKKDILLREEHHIPACVKMMMLLIRDGLKNLKNDEKYKKLTALLRKKNTQQTRFNVLTDFMAHDAAASEQTPASLTEDGELDTLIEDISSNDILEVLRLAETYQRCFNTAFNNQNINRPIRRKEANNNNNQGVLHKDEPMPNINDILSHASFKPSKKSNSEKNDNQIEGHFKKKS